jgi:cytochrome c oxidase cbb3-type subunit I/II
MYWLRLGGGGLYLLGTILCGFNFIMTWRARPAKYEAVACEAPSAGANFVEVQRPKSRVHGAPVLEIAHDFDVWLQGWWHHVLESRPFKFALWVLLAVVVASACEIVPIMLYRSGPTQAAPKPYTPLELLGRDIYVSNGCCNCHSQMIRPILSETKRYGEYSKQNDSVFDHPAQWGSRRIGPDLAREGMNRTPGWHAMHLHDPQLVTSGSVMPDYKWMFETKADFDSIPRRMRAMRALSVPYSSEEIAGGIDAARKQAGEIATAIETEYPIADLNDKEVVALIAYLNRLGREPAAPSPAIAGQSTRAEKQAAK